MKLHKIKEYHDGYRNIRFCETCGKEDLQLIDTECGPIGQKKVDKDKEPS